MRTKFQFSLLFLLIGLFMFSPMSAMANEHYISDVSGLTVGGNIPTDGSTVTFTIGLNNTGPNNITGFTNGFRVYSNTGAQWTTTVPAFTGAITTAMMSQTFTNEFSIDGAGADTVGFGGFRIMEPGIPIGDIPNAFTITVGPVDASYSGGEICIDSSFYPPAGRWVWSISTGDLDPPPTWSGLSCYGIGDVVANNAPVLDPIGALVVDEGALLSFDATATDADGDPLTYSITTTDLPVGYTFTPAGHFEWTPGLTESGVYTAQVEVTDGTDTDFEIITITVNNFNQAPVLAPVGDKSTIEGSNLNFTLSATDPDGGLLTYSFVSVPPMNGATLEPVLGVFDWTPDFNASGIYTVTMTVSDGLLTDEEIITITVDNFNQTPILVGIGNKTTDEGVNLNFTISGSDADGDPLTYLMTSLDLPPAATFDALTQTFDWTPSFADAGIYSATFRVMDGITFDEETITITVSNINQNPVLDLVGNQTTDENLNLTFTATATDPDIEDALVFALINTDLPLGYTFVNGVFEWTPTFDDAGLYTATITVTDGLITIEETISITVNNVNRSPILEAIGNKFTAENINLNFIIIASDPDFDVLILSMTSIDLPVGATFNPATRTFDWTPTLLDAGTYSATFTAFDGDLTAEETITITVNNENQAPVLDPIGAQFANENELLTFTATATDADLDALTFEIINADLPQGYTFIDGVFEWTTSFDDAGVYFVTVQVTDGIASDVETFDITVNNINRAPALDLIGDFIIDEDINLNFVITGSDPDNDGLTYSMTSPDLPFGAVFDALTQTFDWTPTFSDAGVYSVTFSVTDGFISIDESITITVNNISQWSLNLIGDKAFDENSNLNFAVTYSNPDAIALTLTATGIPVGATFVGDVFDWTTSYDDAGSYPVTFSLTDGITIQEETIIITVNDVNRMPVLNAIGDQFTDETVLLTFTASGSDPDGDALTFTFTSGDLPLGYTFVDGLFEWTPTFDDAGVYSGTVTITDGGLTAEETFAITVFNVNRNPLLDPIGDYTLDEGSNLNFIITGSDPDNDGLTYSMTSPDLPVGATFDALTQTFDWTPNFSDDGVYSATFTISDGILTAEETITITVNNITQWTLNSIGDKAFDENSNLNFTVTYSNPEAISLTLTATGIPVSATFAGDVFDWTTSFDDAGVYPVTFSLTDGVTTQEETINITVNNVNRLPRLNAIGNQSTDETALLTFTASGSDPDGDALTFTFSSADLPVGFTFVDGLFNWTPTYDDAGVYSGTVTVSDGSLTSEETFTITVNDVNRTPVLDLVGDKTINETLNLNFIVTGSDPDGDALTYSMSSIDLPVGATFDALTQTFDWTPGLDDAGVYSASFTVTDGTLSDDETITITVTNENQAPVIAAIEDIFMTECDYLEITFSAVDPDGDPIALTLTGGNDSMKFVDNNDGTGNLTYNPSYDDAGVYNLTLSATDGNTTVDAQFIITVEDCLPPYIMTIDNPSTVPGASQAVAINYGNSSELISISGTYNWTTDFLFLDSVSFMNGSGIGHLTNASATIDNVTHTLTISASVQIGEAKISAGGGLLATLYFSIDAGTLDDLYPLTTSVAEMSYECLADTCVEAPFLIDGGIGIQATETFTCGTIIDEAGVPIADATVELWDSYPFAKGTVDAVQTNSFGAFAFDNITLGTFSIYAYKETYYPGIERDLNPPATGLMITLNPVPAVVETPIWMDFYCSGINTLNDVPMPVGSVVDAYTMDDIHVGSRYVTEAGSYGLFMPVYGTAATINAANLGDVIRFFINGIEAIPSHTPIWTGQGTVDEICLAASYEVTHSCTLVEGWNLVSWNADTPSDQILEVLASISDCIEVVHGFEQGGLTYVPSLVQFSTLTEVDHLSGYWIKISEGCNNLSLDVTGSPVPETTPIALTEGWNLVSYLPEITLPTTDALESINGNIDVVFGYDNGGSVYIPGDPLSALDEMTTCFGYWIKVLADDILTYPGAGKAGPSAKLATSKLAADAGQKFAKTNNWISMYSNALTLNDYPVSSGTEISAVNFDGTTVGSFTIGANGLFGFMSVYADDPNTSEIDGVKIGETFNLVVDGHQTSESFTWTQNGERIEVAALTTTDDIKPLPGSYSLNQNYPNPFNPSTTINFSIAKAGQAKIEVYNILGELVATPFDGQAIAGPNQIIWDGTDRSGKTVSSGIYFYRLTADNYSETKKMTLLK